MDLSDQIYVWGSDTWGQLGLGGRQTRAYSLPQICSYGVRVMQVACGEEHALLLTPEGALYAFGSNADGRLGIGDRSMPLRSLPTLVPDLVSYPIIGVACGAGHSAAVSAAGELYTWGQGKHGALGTGGSLNHWSPQQISFPSGCTVQAVFCGGRHTSALVKDPVNVHSTVYMCGAGEAGQLGLGRKDSELLPKKLVLEADIGSVAAGYAHTLFLTTSGSVYSTGSNATGQLGTGNRKSAKRPVLISGLNNIVRIAAGTHSAGISRDSKLYLWGSGVFGEYLTPQKVKSAVEAQSISLGNGFGAVLDTKGHIWTWGSNAVGELGHGDTDIRLTPFPVMALKDRLVRLIACGSAFILAVGTPNDRKMRSVEGESRRTRSSLPIKDLRTLQEGREMQINTADSSRRGNALRREVEEWRNMTLEAQEALSRQLSEFAWRSQASLSQQELLSGRAKQADYLEERLRDLEATFQSTQSQLQSSALTAAARVEEANSKKLGLESELKAARTDINRLETRLIAALRAKTEIDTKLERTSFTTEATLQELSRRQSELERNYILQSHSDSSQIESLTAEKTQLSTSLQRTSEARDIAQSELEEMQGRVNRLERGIEEREEAIELLRTALEKKEGRNRKLVEALEGEVRRRAGTLRRAKATVSVGADSRSFSSLDHTRPSSVLTDSKSSSFHHTKSLLEARLDAFEQKLSTLQPSKTMF